MGADLIAVFINENGLKKFRTFLKEKMKNENLYSIEKVILHECSRNLDVCYNHQKEIVSGRPFSIELKSFETKSGHPERIDFSFDDFLFFELEGEYEEET